MIYYGTISEWERLSAEDKTKYDTVVIEPKDNNLHESILCKQKILPKKTYDGYGHYPEFYDWDYPPIGAPYHE